MKKIILIFILAASCCLGSDGKLSCLVYGRVVKLEDKSPAKFNKKSFSEFLRKNSFDLSSIEGISEYDGGVYFLTSGDREGIRAAKDLAILLIYYDFDGVVISNVKFIKFHRNDDWVEEK